MYPGFGVWAEICRVGTVKSALRHPPLRLRRIRSWGTGQWMCSLKVAQQGERCKRAVQSSKEGGRSFPLGSRGCPPQCAHERSCALRAGGVGIEASAVFVRMNRRGAAACADCVLKVGACITSFAGSVMGFVGQSGSSLMAEKTRLRNPAATSNLSESESGRWGCPPNGKPFPFQPHGQSGVARKMLSLIKPHSATRPRGVALHQQVITLALSC